MFIRPSSAVTRPMLTQDALDDATELLSECIAYPRVRATRAHTIQMALHARQVRLGAAAVFRGQSTSKDLPSPTRRNETFAARKARLRVLGEGGLLSPGAGAGTGSGGSE